MITEVVQPAEPPDGIEQQQDKCFANVHMRPEEFALWTLSRSLQHHTGKLYFDGRDLAKKFEDTGKDRIYRAAKALTKKGWFKVLAPARMDDRTGRWSATQYLVLSHEEWAKEHPDSCPNTSPRNETGTSPENANGSEPVLKTRMTSRVLGTYFDVENTDISTYRENEDDSRSDFRIEDWQDEPEQSSDLSQIWPKEAP